MGYPRRHIVDYSISAYYHCVSRCVRRARLCGDQWEHRRTWMEERLGELLGIFAIASCAYAILSNHVHIVLRTIPEAARRWSDLEVATRWCRLFPKLLERAKSLATTPQEAQELERRFIESLAAQKDRIRILRARLSDVGWFHKLLKEPLARQANEEDNCTGHFWEGRFRCFRLLDQAAILACMVYVDLNLVRAKMVKALKECKFTSLLQRLKVIRAPRPDRPGRGKRKAQKPMEQARTSVRLLPTEELLGMTATEYVSLVAQTGGVPIDAQDHEPRLKGLGIDPARWKTVLTTTARRVGSVVGNALNCLKEAERRRVQRVVNALDVYRKA